MTKSYEFTGRTTEEAISAGLNELNMVISDVTVEVLVEGSKGLFGLFGSRPAKVRLTVKEDEEEKEDSVFAHMLDETKAEPVEKKTKKPQPKQEQAAPVKKEEAPAKKAAPAAAAEEEKAAVPAEKKEPKKNNRKPKAEKPKAETEQKTAEEPAEEPRILEPAELKDPESGEGKAQQFLMNITRLMGVDVQVYASRDEEGNIRINMMGDSKGILIGRRGETLDALQYLTSLMVNKGQNEYTRVTLDTENYRAKREEVLARLANRMANRCQKTGKRVSLEPMNPYERRIIHAALQNNGAVTTHSEGEEPNRHIVITLK